MAVRKPWDTARIDRREQASAPSPPSKSWLFAQELLGKQVQDSSWQAEEAKAKEELINWVNSILPPHERIKSPSAEPSEAWKFAQDILGKSISDSTRRFVQDILGKSEVAEEELRQWVADITTFHEGSWDPAKHPRGGFSQNRGWWSPTDGSGVTGTQASGDPNRKAGPQPILFTVSNKTPKQGATRSGSPAHSSSNAKPPESSRDQTAESPENRKLNKDELLTYFKLLYGDKGQKLLAAFEKSQGLVKVESPWSGAKSALDGRNAWGPQQIRVHENLNPVEAAQELMEQLIKASGWTEVRQHLDHSGFANIETLIDSYKQSVKQAAAAVALASELYLSGISIVNEGADWVVTINDLSEGNYYAAIGLLPLLPASVGKTGVILKHGGKSLRITAEAVQRIKALPVEELIALLESTRKLARNMEKAGIARSVNTAAHHIVPANLSKFRSAQEARAILARFGIGVENAVNGVYLPSKFDDAIKAAYHGTLHSKRYSDEVLDRLKEARSKEDALLILNQIRKDLLAGKFPH